MTISWTGNGWSIERAARASTTDLEAPRSAHEVILFSPAIELLGRSCGPKAPNGTRRKRNLSGGEKARPDPLTVAATPITPRKIALLNESLDRRQRVQGFLSTASNRRSDLPRPSR